MTNGFSAKVVLTLFVNELELALSHVGPSGLVIRDDCDPLPAQNAKLRIQIDDSVESVDVFLPDGVAGPGTKVAFI